jgi:hypothetical protein
VILYTFPPSTVQASLPFLPVYWRNRDGGTRRYGVDGGSPRRLASGLLERCAQSRGECPGVNWAFSRGLVRIAVRLGGRARDEFDASGARIGRGEREGGGDRELMERSGGWATGKELRRGGPRPPEAR